MPLPHAAMRGAASRPSPRPAPAPCWPGHYAVKMEDLMYEILICLPTPPFSTARGKSAAAFSSSSSNGGSPAGDRISRLPTSLLSDIVSRLPAKDAARTAALSTRWRRLWASTPLVLDDTDLFGLPEGVRMRGGGRTIKWDAIASAVNHILVTHPGPFRCVHITSCSMLLVECLERRDALSRWLRLLAAKRVQDLVFVNRPKPLDMELPADVLRISSVRRLYLGFWELPNTAGLPRGPEVFPHLLEIGLCYTIIASADVDYLLQCSPVLEKFALIFCPPVHVRVRSLSLRCMVWWMSGPPELAMVATPCLQRLILWQTLPGVPGCVHIKVKIGHTPELRVLGYLEPSIHVLEIGNTIIQAGTTISPANLVPSVEILALKVRFGIRKEAKMLPNYLRCFPNVETLHIMSDEADEPSGKFNLKSWQEVGPIYCLHSHIKKVVFSQFRGKRMELAFLRFILERAQMLKKLVVVLANGDTATVDDEVCTKLKALAMAKRASECPTVLIVAREGDSAWCFRRASDLSVSDPFEG